MSDLKFLDLSIGYEKKPLIENINGEIKAGEILACIGPNGAGKSTLLKTAAGLLSPVSGSVYLDKENIHDMNVSERARKVAVMLTTRTTTEYATCMEVVSVGLYQYTGMLGRLTADDLAHVDDVLEMVGASELKNKDFSKLSDGQKQRILLARALVQKPEVLIMDEPTGFLDVGYKLDFMSTIRRLAKDNNITIFISMHEVELIKSIADKVMCITKDNRIDKVCEANQLSAEYIEQLFGMQPGLYRRFYHE